MPFPKILLTFVNLAGALVVGIFLVFPTYQNFQDLEKQIQRKNAELQSKSEYFFQLTSISRKLQEYQAQLSKIDTAIPESVSIPALLNILQSKASKSGLVVKELESASIQDNTSNLRLKDISITITLAGSYSSLKEFISDLEASSKLFTIKKISFKSPEKGGSFEFKLSIVTHSY